MAYRRRRRSKKGGMKKTLLWIGIGVVGSGVIMSMASKLPVVGGLLGSIKGAVDSAGASVGGSNLGAENKEGE